MSRSIQTRQLCGTQPIFSSFAPLGYIPTIPARRHLLTVVGWAMDRRMKKALLILALMMAINLRKPPPGLIHHSDRGSQYASHAYQTLLKQHDMIASMSRKDNCWDNAPVERFFSSLKREWTGNRLTGQGRRRSLMSVNMWRCITTPYVCIRRWDTRHRLITKTILAMCP